MLGFAALGELALGQSAQSGAPTGESAVGTFVLSGRSALFQQIRTADGGTFSLGGQSSLRLFTLNAGAGGFAASINAAAFKADGGSFVLTLQPANLLFAGYPGQIRIFPRVARGAHGALRGGGVTVRPSVGKGLRARAFGG